MHAQAGMDLTGISPFKNAQYTPTVPVQHCMYGHMPGVQNLYLDDVNQVCWPSLYKADGDSLHGEDEP